MPNCSEWRFERDECSGEAIACQVNLAAYSLMITTNKKGIDPVTVNPSLLPFGV
jgi:hypothetical protein